MNLWKRKTKVKIGIKVTYMKLNPPYNNQMVNPFQWVTTIVHWVTRTKILSKWKTINGLSMFQTPISIKVNLKSSSVIYHHNSLYAILILIHRVINFQKTFSFLKSWSFSLNNLKTKSKSHSYLPSKAKKIFWFKMDRMV